MSNSVPPPLPHSDPAWEVWRTYLRAVAFLTPTILAWSFSITFVLPKVQQLWLDAGLTTSSGKWLINTTYSLMHYAQFLFLGVVILLLLLELRWSAWPRYRRVVLACATLFFHTAVLVGITSMSLAACLAAPVLVVKSQKMQG